MSCKKKKKKVFLLSAVWLCFLVTLLGTSQGTLQSHSHCPCKCRSSHYFGDSSASYISFSYFLLSGISAPLDHCTVCIMHACSLSHSLTHSHRQNGCSAADRRTAVRIISLVSYHLFLPLNLDSYCFWNLHQHLQVCSVNSRIASLNRRTDTVLACVQLLPLAMKGR